MRPDLDAWLARPQVRVHHRREVAATPADLWRAATSVRLGDARRLGRMVRLRIPGLSSEISFHEMFRSPPFNVLHEDDEALVSGLVGRIWTLRRDYPLLSGPEEFREWSARGTVRVLFANWVEQTDTGNAGLVSETRIAAVDRRGRIGLTAVRPLIASSNRLVFTDGMEVALRRLRRPPPGSEPEPS